MATSPTPPDFIIPTVGMSGYFDLREPFATLMAKNVRYTCQAVRRISDYIAANEDVKTDIYAKNQIPEDVYDADVARDAFILSLQAETGQWLYVPDHYNISFPSTNGIPYRTMAFAVQLPAMPANRDYTNVITDMQNLIRDTLGVDCVVNIVETSKITLVPSDKHENKQAERDAISGAATTDRSRYMKTLQDLEGANQIIDSLQTYILANAPPP